MPVRVRIVRDACIYVGEEVVVTLGKQKDRTHMKTKTKMSAVKLAAVQLYNLLVWLYRRPVACDSAYFGGYVLFYVCLNSEQSQMKPERVTVKNVCEALCLEKMVPDVVQFKASSRESGNQEPKHG